VTFFGGDVNDEFHASLENILGVDIASIKNKKRSNPNRKSLEDGLEGTRLVVDPEYLSFSSGHVKDYMRRFKFRFRMLVVGSLIIAITTETCSSSGLAKINTKIWGTQ